MDVYFRYSSSAGFLRSSIGERIMFQITQASMDFALKVANTVAVIGFVAAALAYILGKIEKRK